MFIYNEIFWKKIIRLHKCKTHQITLLQASVLILSQKTIKPNYKYLILLI